MMGGQHELVLDRMGADTLFVTQARQDVVYWILPGQVTEIDVRARRSPGMGAPRGLVIGDGIGAALGFLVGVASWNDETESCGDNPLGDVCGDTVSAARPVGYVTLFGVPGMAIGEFVGAAAPAGGLCVLGRNAEGARGVIHPAGAFVDAVSLRA